MDTGSIDTVAVAWTVTALAGAVVVVSIVLLVGSRGRERRLRAALEDRDARPQTPPLTSHDALTGLATAALFEELVRRALDRSGRSGTPLAVLVADVDGVEQVNAAFGPRTGDRVLAETGRRLGSGVRPGDLLARVDGDVFAVICENLGSATDAATIASRVVELVSKPIPVEEGVAAVRVSVGAAVALPAEQAASVLARARAAAARAAQDGTASYRVAEMTAT